MHTRYTHRAIRVLPMAQEFHERISGREQRHCGTLSREFLFSLCLCDSVLKNAG
jgi:hypothetical protein